MSLMNDWAALARLASVALSLASLLGLVAWWRGSLSKKAPAARIAALTALTLFLCFDLVAFGAYTRLSDSGLGCPDWPGCYGEASPLGADAHIAQAETSMPSGPVTERKAWIEMIHRYLAGAVGVLIIAITVLAVRARATLPGAWKLPALTLAWVIAQGLFGWLTVRWKLYPAIVTAHLLGGLGLLALLGWQYRGWVSSKARPARAAEVLAQRGTRPALWLACGVLLVQVALGGWVSTNDAVLACTGFPGCNGAWWPAAGLDAWREGFTLLRERGHRADGQVLSYEALMAIHWAHRLFALVVLAALTRLVLRLRAAGEAGQRWAWIIAGLLLLQLSTGLSNVVLGWPLIAALAHTAGAAALVLALCAWAVVSRRPALTLAASSPSAATGRRASNPGRRGRTLH